MEPPAHPARRQSSPALTPDHRPLITTPPPVKPHELFQNLDPVIVQEIFTTFREEERDVYKSAVSSLAQARKLRPVFIQKKPVPEQIAWMSKTLGLRSSDMIGEHLLQVWFMKFNQPLLIAFCDGMEIPHNGEGSVEGALPNELDAEKLKATIEGLYQDFNPKVVSLYLLVFNLQRPGGWESLAELIASDPRVKLGNEPEPEAAPEPAADPVQEEPPAASDEEESPAAEEAGANEEE